jgi:hypothetical protein
MLFPEMMHPEMAAIGIDQEAYLHVKIEACKPSVSQRSVSNG